jgi:nucleoid DNA-binding protein
MVIDDTVKRIFKQVQSKLLKKKGYELSLTEIQYMVQSQFTTALIAINKKIDIRLISIGTFIDMDRHKRKTQEIHDSIYLEELAKLEGEYAAAQEHLRIKIAVKESLKGKKTQARTTIEEFLAKEDFDGISNHIYNTLNPKIKDE